MASTPALLAEIHDETPSVRRLVLSLEEDYPFTPGQAIDVFHKIEGRQNVLSLALCSPAQEHNRRLEVAVKRSAHPVAQHFFEAAQAGDALEISPRAFGNVIFRPQFGDEVVLIAGGIGISPLLSIFRTIETRWRECRAYLIYSAAHPEEFAFRAEIQAACAQFPNLKAWFNLSKKSEQAPEWISHQGHITADWLETLEIPTLAHHYLCGPEAMRLELEQILLQQGVLKETIHYELW